MKHITSCMPIKDENQWVFFMVNLGFFGGRCDSFFAPVPMLSPLAKDLDPCSPFAVGPRTDFEAVLLMVIPKPTTTERMVLKPGKSWEILPTSTGERRISEPSTGCFVLVFFFRNLMTPSYVVNAYFLIVFFFPPLRL